MTIKERNNEINMLIKNGRYESVFLDETYVYELKDNKIYLDNRYSSNLDIWLDTLSFNARRAYYIEEILKSINIDIGNIESDYHLTYSSETNMIFYQKNESTYTFIEFFNELFIESGKNICVVKINLNNNDLTFDRIDIHQGKHYHADSKLSQETLEAIYNDSAWKRKTLSHNCLYDIKAEDCPSSKYSSLYTNMSDYGNYISNLNLESLDKSIFDVQTELTREDIPMRIYLR